MLEVSSFGTKAKRDAIPTDAAAFLDTPDHQRQGKFVYPTTARCLHFL